MRNSSINLIPRKLRYAIQVRDLFNSWLAMLVLVVIACTLTGAIKFRRLMMQKQRVDELAERSEPICKLISQVEVLNDRTNQLVELNEELTRLVPGDDLLQLLGVIAQAFGQDPGKGPRLERMRIELSDAKAAGSIEGTTNAASNVRGVDEPDSWNMTFNIIGNDDEAIDRCLDRVRENERFREVRIRNTIANESTGDWKIEADALVFVQKELPQ